MKMQAAIHRNINKAEQIWLNKILSIDFKGKEIIRRQILASKVVCEKIVHLFH
jgi:hypothetical protein